MNKNIIGHLLAFFTVFVWSTTFVSSKIILQYMTPAQLVIIRFFLGYIALWVFKPKPLIINNIKKEIYFILAGLFGVTLYFLFENIALLYSMASNVGIIVSVVPFFVAICSVIFLKEPLPKISFFIGFVLAMLGICIIGIKDFTSVHFSPLGDFLALMATVVWAFYSVTLKKISTFNYNILQTTRRIFMYGVIFLIPIALHNGPLDLSVFTNIKILGNILFLSFLASATCYTTWSIAQEKLGVVKTSVYIYLSPVITTVASAIVLKENITFMTIVGICLTLGGLILSQSKKLG